MGDNVWEMPSPERVLECIEAWRKLDSRRASIGEIDAALSELITGLGNYVTTSNENSFLSLFRVRPLDRTFPWSELGDFMYPPPDRMQLGRCNGPTECVLYCARKLETAILETLRGIRDAQPSGRFMLVNYGARDVKLATVVPDRGQGQQVLDRDGMIAQGVLREFIRSEFSKPVGPETEFLYKISSAICRVWFDAARYDGWVYPSCQDATATCIALKKDYVDQSDRFWIQKAEIRELVPGHGLDPVRSKVVEVWKDDSWQPVLDR